MKLSKNILGIWNELSNNVPPIICLINFTNSSSNIRGQKFLSCLEIGFRDLPSIYKNLMGNVLMAGCSKE